MPIKKKSPRRSVRRSPIKRRVSPKKKASVKRRSPKRHSVKKKVSPKKRSVGKQKGGDIDVEYYCEEKVSELLNTNQKNMKNILAITIEDEIVRNSAKKMINKYKKIDSEITKLLMTKPKSRDKPVDIQNRLDKITDLKLELSLIKTLLLCYCYQNWGISALDLDACQKPLVQPTTLRKSTSTMTLVPRSISSNTLYPGED